MRAVPQVTVLIATLLFPAAVCRAQLPVTQNPSPMVEHTRAHVRITPQELAGITRTFTGPLGKPIELFITAKSQSTHKLKLVVHFFGTPFIPQYAVAQLGADYAVAVVNIGSGSGIYDRTFTEPAAFDSLLANIQRETTAALGHVVAFQSITLSGFSAGHGAIRAILRDSTHFENVNAVLLLDGLHTSYVPEGTPLEKGGALDTHNLDAFVRFGRAAMRGEKRFVITHSEIFPGTFASTTETTDYLALTLGIVRLPVLRWGPGGMQQLSDATRGRFEILGFAGNTAPDHIDQFQGMSTFLRLLERR